MSAAAPAERRALLQYVIAFAGDGQLCRRSRSAVVQTEDLPPPAAGSCELRLQRWDSDEHRWVLSDATAEGQKLHLQPCATYDDEGNSLPAAETVLPLADSRVALPDESSSSSSSSSAAMAVVAPRGERTYLKPAFTAQMATLQVYRVRRRAKVSAQHTVGSAKVATLAVGQTIRAFVIRSDETGHTRVRCLRGWVSVRSQQGTVLLDPARDEDVQHSDPAEKEEEEEEATVLQFRVVRRATVRASAARSGRKVAKLAVGTIVDVSDMVTDTDGWAWLRVNSDSGGWCCAAAANGQAQLERVDDLVGDLEEESQATSARQLPWQAIVSLLESTTIASTAAAGSRGRTAVSQQHEALLNAVMDCSEAQARFIAQWLAGRMEDKAGSLLDTMRLVLELKAAPRLRRELQTYYSLDGHRDIAAASSRSELKELGQEVDRALLLSEPQLQRVVSDYKEGVVNAQERDKQLDWLWDQRKQKSEHSKMQKKFKAFGVLLDDTVDTLLDTKQAVSDLLGKASGEEELIAMLRDPPAFSSTVHMQWLLDAVLHSGGTLVSATAALTRRGEDRYLYGEQIDLTSEDLDRLDATRLLATLERGREVNLDLDRYWRAGFQNSREFSRVSSADNNPQKVALRWLGPHSRAELPSLARSHHTDAAVVRKLVLSGEMEPLTQAANMQLYHSLVFTALCDLDGVVDRAREEALQAVAERSSSSGLHTSVERELMRTQSKVLRLRREVMGEASVAELLEDNDAVVGHITQAIEMLLEPVETALSSFALSQQQHDLLIATAAFDCVHCEPHQIGVPGLLRLASERLRNVGQLILASDSASALEPLEKLTLEALDERARPWLLGQINEGFFSMGAGDDDNQQMLQSLFDAQIQLRAAVEGLDASSRRIRKAIARDAILSAANYLFVSATASLPRPFGPVELQQCCIALLKAVRLDDWKTADGKPNPNSARERLSFALPVRLYSSPHRPFFQELARLVCLAALRTVPTDDVLTVFGQAVPDSEAALWFTAPLASAVAMCQQTILGLLTDLRSEDEKLNLVRVLDESHLIGHAAQRSVEAGGAQESAQGEGDRQMPAPSVVWALQAWIANLTTSEDTLIRRLIETETWVPSDLAGVYSSSKARDLLQLLYSHITVFFSLQIPAPIAFARAAEKVWAGIGTYLRIVHSFCNAETAIPPCPPLRKPAVTPSEQEIQDELPHLFPAEGTAALAETSLSSVILMLNDCCFLHEQCTQLNERITSAWVELCATDPAYQSVSDEGVRISNYQCRTVLSAIELVYLPAILEYLGARVSYFELREPLLCRLFTPTVARAPLHTIARALAADILPLIERTIDPQCGEQAFQAIARWCLKAILRVLLDGGRARSFHISDAAKLDLQLGELLEFFSTQMDVAESVLEPDIKPLVRVIHWMAMEQHALEQECAAMPTVPAAPSEDVVMPDCQYRIVQVLARRASDPRAQRFVKKRVKDFDQVHFGGWRPQMPTMHLADGMAMVLGDARKATPQNGGAMVRPYVVLAPHSRSITHPTCNVHSTALSYTMRMPF
jgi:hypothetical protein